MPTQLQSPDAVQVFYTHPGDRSNVRECVWLEPEIDETYSVTAMRTDRRRRTVRTRFNVAIQVLLEGKVDVGDVSPLQYACDMQAAAIRQIIDESIADEQHLSSPDLVDWAKLNSGRIERGMTATGVGTRLFLSVECESRIL